MSGTLHGSMTLLQALRVNLPHGRHGAVVLK